jgi:hypothetical protein
VAAGEADQVGGTPDAAALMASVVAQLPREPLSISGEIEVTRRHGVVVGKLGFEMNLDFGAEPPSARYTLRDAARKNLARLTLERHASNVVSRFETGVPLRPAVMPDTGAPVLDTDMTWQDLTLSFLWWRQAKVLGEDVVKGRACHVVELDAPPGEPPGKVKLWVDRQVPMMLQAEAFDGKGKKVRSLWVKSFRKIKERWMVREMEIQQEPPSHRTHITVTDLDGRKIGEAETEDRVDPQPVGDAGSVTNRL